MHCPKCGQLQISDEIRFCSKCGLPLAGIAEVLAHGGTIPGSFSRSEASPRRRGVLQGLFIFFLSFLVVPVIAMITIGLDVEPIGVAISAILLTMGGLLRVAYALMFESSTPVHLSGMPAGTRALNDGFPGRGQVQALPEGITVPVSAYSAPAPGTWRDTNDLTKQPASVTDSTTKLLDTDR